MNQIRIKREKINFLTMISSEIFYQAIFYLFNICKLKKLKHLILQSLVNCKKIDLSSL